MNDYNNLECKRCGNQWYSKKFEEENKMPDECPYCYQNSVREIPSPPTKIDKAEEKLSEIKKEVPEKAEEKKHQLILWKENNKLLLSMTGMGAAIIGLIGAMTYLLFF